MANTSSVADAAAQRERERAAIADAAAQAASDATIAELRALKPAQRVKRIRDLCQLGVECPSENSDQIVNAAATDAERASLQQLIADIQSKRAIAAAKAMEPTQKDRQALADVLDTSLLEKHMNPDGVHAYGKTLHVDGWFCTRQFMFDFASGPMNAQAEAQGFKRLECSNGIQTWSQDL